MLEILDKITKGQATMEDLDKLEEIDDNQQEYLHELIEFLGGWLINHILKMDTQIEKTEQ